MFSWNSRNPYLDKINIFSMKTQLWKVGIGIDSIKLICPWKPVMSNYIVVIYVFFVCAVNSDAGHRVVGMTNIQVPSLKYTVVVLNKFNHDEL